MKQTQYSKRDNTTVNTRNLEFSLTRTFVISNEFSFPLVYYSIYIENPFAISNAGYLEQSLSRTFFCYPWKITAF